MEVWGHRGAYHHTPENTIESFVKAIELKADGIELDVQMTHDGEVVVAHDERLERVSDGFGYLKNYTLDVLKTFNFNKRGISKPLFMEIPTLEEVLKLLKNTNLKVNIEFKTGLIYYEGIEQKTIDLVKKHGMNEQVLYSSFNHYSLQKIKAIDKNSKTALLCGGGILVTAEQCERIGAFALHPHINQLQYPDLVKDCHKRGIKVHVWTVDNDKDYRIAINSKVDAIIVNDLEKYRK